MKFDCAPRVPTRKLSRRDSLGLRSLDPSRLTLGEVKANALTNSLPPEASVDAGMASARSDRPSMTHRSEGVAVAADLLPDAREHVWIWPLTATVPLTRSQTSRNQMLSFRRLNGNTHGKRMALFPSGTDWAEARQSARLTTSNHEDMHAGELETSILLHVNPKLVRDGYQAADWTADDRRHLLTTGMSEYTQSGVIGRPSLASAEKGKALLASLVESFAPVLEILQRALHAPRSRTQDAGRVSPVLQERPKP